MTASLTNRQAEIKNRSPARAISIAVADDAVALGNGLLKLAVRPVAPAARISGRGGCGGRVPAVSRRRTAAHQHPYGQLPSRPHQGDRKSVV